MKKRVVLPAVLAAFLFFINASVLIEPARNVYASGHRNDTFTVYSANINKDNTDFSDIADTLRAADADILLVLEVTEKHLPPLQSLIMSYPYHMVNLNVGSSGTGTALMSKFPILNKRITKYTETGNMLVSVTMKIGGREVMFYATHFPRPQYDQGLNGRAGQVMSLVRQIRERTMPVIVAGDLNATPYSPLFRELIDAGLSDSRDGFGWQPTWPTSFPLLWIPIDHVLVSPEIMVHNRATGAYTGSDHYPIVAELSIY